MTPSRCYLANSQAVFASGVHGLCYKSLYLTSMFILTSYKTFCWFAVKGPALRNLQSSLPHKRERVN